MEPNGDPAVITDTNPLADATWGCSRLRERLGADRVAVWVLSEATGTLTPVVAAAIDDDGHTELGRRWARTPLDTVPLFSEVITHGHVQVVEDAATDPRLPANLVSEFGISSVRFERLVGDRPVGVLSVEPADCVIEEDLEDLVLLLALTVGQSSARRQADHQRQQAELLLELSEAAAASGSLSQTLGELCQRLARHARMNRACLYIVENGVARPRMARYADGHEAPEEWARFRSAPGSVEITAEVLATGLPQMAEDPTSPLIAGWWAESFGLGSALAVPVGTAPDITGVLVLDDPMPRAFSADLVRLMAAAGGHVDAMITRATSDDERTWRLRTLGSMRTLLQQGAQTTSMHETGALLASVAAEAFDAAHALFVQQRDGTIVDLATIGIDEDRTARLRDALVGERFDRYELWQQSLERAAPMIVGAPQAASLPPTLLDVLDAPSCVILPLMSDGDPVGVVHVGSNQRTWRDHHESLADQLSLEAKLVVDNTLLRQKNRERLAELAHNATHDALTGLPNRALFEERLAQAFKQPRLAHHEVGLLFIDLDRFKHINDTVGHVIADELLREVARRLRRCTRSEDTVARFAGDEFIVLLPNAKGMADAERVAERVGVVLSEPVDTGDGIIRVTASVGIACMAPDTGDANRLLRDADAAMFRVKRAGRGGYAVHGTSQNDSQDVTHDHAAD